MGETFYKKFFPLNRLGGFLAPHPCRIGLIALFLWAYVSGSFVFGNEEAVKRNEAKSLYTFMPGEMDVSIDGHYRVRYLLIDPLELNGLEAQYTDYAEQRLRLNLKSSFLNKVSIRTEFDILDGVVFGDNGLFASEVSSNEGITSGATVPNNTTTAVAFVGDDPEDDPLNPDSYRLVAQNVEAIKVNRIWGEVLLPFGLLRVGRQPTTEGRSIIVNDGNGLTNRFGVNSFGDTSDRILFATKISEIFNVVRYGKGYVVDPDPNKGVFLFTGYDIVVEDEVSNSEDDLDQILGGFFVVSPKFRFLGLPFHDFRFQYSNGVRINQEFDFRFLSTLAHLHFGIGNFRFSGEFAPIFGHTREISKATDIISGKISEEDEGTLQDIRSYGIMAEVGYRLGPAELIFEFDLATGDDDPGSESDITSFTFAEDTNVGLLIFEQILAFETARSAAVGNDLLKSQNAIAFPTTQISTEGAVTNTIALFPQAVFHAGNAVDFYLGTLIAWAEKPVVDPILSLIKGEDVNFNGGAPGDFYGVELDGRFTWKLYNRFHFDLESAFLFPGNAFHDEHKDAVNSFFLEGRFTFLF